MSGGLKKRHYYNANNTSFNNPIHGNDWLVPRCDNHNTRSNHELTSNCMMAPFRTNCDSCDLKFISTTALLKHRRSKHRNAHSVKQLPFYDGQEIIAVPDPYRGTPSSNLQREYKVWLSGVTESINSALHPKVSGKRNNLLEF